MMILEMKEAYDRRLAQECGIRKLLLILNVTQSQFGQAIGMRNRNQLNMYLQGKIPLTLGIARRVQRYAKEQGIHISLEEIYTDEIKLTKEISAARNCQELAKAKGFELSLDEIFADDEGEDDGS